MSFRASPWAIAPDKKLGTEPISCLIRAETEMGGTGGPTVLEKLGFAKTKYKSRRLSGNSLNVISALGGQPGVVSAKKPQCSESGGIRCSQLVVACVFTADLPTSHAHSQSRLARLSPAYSRSWPAATCTPICCSIPLSLYLAVQLEIPNTILPHVSVTGRTATPTFNRRAYLTFVV